MGPPPFGDGNSSIADATSSAADMEYNRQTFNGATAFRRWKPSSTSMPWGCTKYLQWGHRLSAMETICTVPVAILLAALQWGHRLSAMETFEADRRRVAERIPSMGPPPFGDGNLCPVPAWWPGGEPSMGPPPFGDGNHPPQSGWPQRTTSPSMGPPPFGDGNIDTGTQIRRGASGLQWGHRLSAMETPPQSSWPHRTTSPSMGPPPFGDGNSHP